MNLTSAIQQITSNPLYLYVRLRCWPDNKRLTIGAPDHHLTLRTGTVQAPWVPTLEQLLSNDWLVFTDTTPTTAPTKLSFMAMIDYINSHPKHVARLNHWFRDTHVRLTENRLDLELYTQGKVEPYYPSKVEFRSTEWLIEPAPNDATATPPTPEPLPRCPRCNDHGITITIHPQLTMLQTESLEPRVLRTGGSHGYAYAISLCTCMRPAQLILGT